VPPKVAKTVWPATQPGGPVVEVVLCVDSVDTEVDVVETVEAVERELLPEVAVVSVEVVVVDMVLDDDVEVEDVSVKRDGGVELVLVRVVLTDVEVVVVTVEMTDVPVEAVVTLD